MEKNKLRTKPLTTCTMRVLELGCYLWKVGRCKLWRQVNDFDYHIYDLRSQFPNQLVYLHQVGDLPFFSKTVETDDEYERTSAVKIGDAVIRYTFNKIARQGLIETTEVIPLFKDIDPHKNYVENVITQTKLSHNSPKSLKVLKLRKGKDDVQLHSK